MTMHVCVDVCVCVCDTAHNSNVHNSNVSLKETTNRFANRHPSAPAVFRNVGQYDSHNDSFQFDYKHSLTATIDLWPCICFITGDSDHTGAKKTR